MAGWLLKRAISWHWSYVVRKPGPCHLCHTLPLTRDAFPWEGLSQLLLPECSTHCKGSMKSASRDSQSRALRFNSMLYPVIPECDALMQGRSGGEMRADPSASDSIVEEESLKFLMSNSFVTSPSTSTTSRSSVYEISFHRQGTTREGSPFPSPV